MLLCCCYGCVQVGDHVDIMILGVLPDGKVKVSRKAVLAFDAGEEYVLPTQQSLLDQQQSRPTGASSNRSPQGGANGRGPQTGSNRQRSTSRSEGSPVVPRQRQQTSPAPRQ